MELEAKDTSKKIRTVMKAKGESGKHLTTNPPYGYIKDPDDNNKWIVDPEAADNVKLIFKLCMEGCGPTQIASYLENEKVLIPVFYCADCEQKLYQVRCKDRTYDKYHFVCGTYRKIKGSSRSSTKTMSKARFQTNAS